MYVCAASGKDPVRERLLENEKNNFKLMAEKVCLSHCIKFLDLHSEFVISFPQLCALGGVPLLALRKEMSNTLPDEKVHECTH